MRTLLTIDTKLNTSTPAYEFVSTEYLSPNDERLREIERQRQLFEKLESQKIRTFLWIFER